MSRRILVTVMVTAATIGLALPSLASPASARVSIASTPITFCGTPAVAPCFTAARDGVPITAADTQWSVSAGLFMLDGATDIDWGVGANPNPPGGYESMGDAEAGEPWSISFDLGNAVIPRVTSTYADDVAIDRVNNGDGTYDLTVSGKVVTMAVNDECHAVTPVTCPDEAGQDITAFQGEISDFQQWTDSSQWPDFYGLDAWTNVEETDIPPQISGDPLQITAPLANSRELATGEVFHGFYHVILPNPFLQDMGIDDPATLDPAGLSTSLGPGAGTVTVTPGPSSAEVDATGITFPVGTDPHFVKSRDASVASKQSAKSRTLRIKRGTITPSRPSGLRAHRTTHRARLSFHRAKPRGSRLTGYQARCYAPHQVTRKTAGKHSPLVAKRLTARLRYRCQVRAKSKAGYGSWSEPVSVRR